MNASINCGLKGAYKVELFSGAGKNRKLVEETDWFSNDITNYGLNYPFTYPFARCFMFLSLGSGAGGNAHPNRQKSTGLYQPISSFWAYDPINGSYRQTGQYIGWQGYEIGGPHNGDFDGTFSSACFLNRSIASIPIAESSVMVSVTRLYSGFSLSIRMASFLTASKRL